MKTILGFVCILFSTPLIAGVSKQVFISFSMPETLLVETVKNASKHHAPVILKGLYNDSMPETASKIFELSKKAPNAAFQIDPLAFDEYQITQVPAFVIKKGKKFDVIVGNLTFERALEEIKAHGDLREEL